MKENNGIHLSKQESIDESIDFFQHFSNHQIPVGDNNCKTKREKKLVEKFDAMSLKRLSQIENLNTLLSNGPTCVCECVCTLMLSPAIKPTKSMKPHE